MFAIKVLVSRPTNLRVGRLRWCAVLGLLKLSLHYKQIWFSNRTCPRPHFWGVWVCDCCGRPINRVKCRPTWKFTYHPPSQHLNDELHWFPSDFNTFSSLRETDKRRCYINLIRQSHNGIEYFPSGTWKKKQNNELPHPLPTSSVKALVNTQTPTHLPNQHPHPSTPTPNWHYLLSIRVQVWSYCDVYSTTVIAACTFLYRIVMSLFGLSPWSGNFVCMRLLYSTVTMCTVSQPVTASMVI